MSNAISVIIPIYNTAPYLRRCLDSVCGQTLKNIEIICVNDGSSDESDAILKEYAARDSRVLPIALGRNLGLSSARNVGIAAACGEWLGFVDSDDSVEPDFYAKLYAEGASGTAEIVKGIYWSERNFPNCINIEFNEKIKTNKLNFIYELCSAIYNTKFIKNNNIYFLQGCQKNEDIAFLYHAILCATNIKVINDAIYKYFYRKNSLNTPLLSYKQITSIISSENNVIDSINKYIHNKKYIIEYKKIIHRCCSYPQKAVPDEKLLICRYIAIYIFKFIEKCRDPNILLSEINRQNMELGALIYSKNIEDLAKYMYLSPVQRLRERASARLKKHP